MLAPLLAVSLWAASVAERPVTPQDFVVVPVEKIANRLAVDLVSNGFGLSWDLGTTWWAIEQGCHEGNPVPLMAESEGRLALKLGQATARGGISYLLRRGGHDRAANIFRYVGMGIDFGLGVNNIVCGVRERKKRA